MRACEAAGLVFIGPTIEQMALFGLKHSAREAAAKARTAGARLPAAGGFNPGQAMGCWVGYR